MSVNLWVNADHAIAYLKEREQLPHRVEAMEVVLELLDGKSVTRVLDLGTGDGNLLALVLAAHPGASGVGLDFGDEMLRRAQERFAGDDRVEIRRHDLSQPLPTDLDGFDAIVSSFAIHHLDPPRVGELYGEIRGRLRPGGVFANAEHVASPTQELHNEFLGALGRTPAEDDPSNQLVSVEQQLTWLNACGFVNSDCFWKWRELAVVAGTNPR